MTKFSDKDLARITISPITKDERGRWTWTVKGYRVAYEGEDYEPQIEPYEISYRTNPEGEGLWVVSTRPGVEERQDLGTMQFSLNASATTRRRRVIDMAMDADAMDAIRSVNHLSEEFHHDPIELYRLAERA